VDHLIALLIVLLAGWFWLDALRAREMALALSRQACTERELQFLDQAVVLRRLGLRWTRQGLRLRRVYRFEYSEGGVGRRTGYLILIGLALEEVSLGLPSRTGDA
jgi:hypothetical protein